MLPARPDKSDTLLDLRTSRYATRVALRRAMQALRAYRLQFHAAQHVHSELSLPDVTTP